MRRLLRRLAFLSLALTACAAAGLWFWPEPARPEVPVPPIHVTLDEGQSWFAAELVQPQDGLTQLPLLTSGRASAGKKDMLIQEWPGFHAEARFRGSSVTVRFQDGLNRWRILLNDGKTGRIDVARPGMSDLHISGLAPAEYRIRVEKISESSMPASFGGILIGPTVQPLPAPRALPRMIEFIGDSDTVGFANTASTRDCTEEEVFSATDTSRSFGPQVASRLGADYRMIARSGIGLLRNYDGAAPLATMTSRYALALPSEPAAMRLPERAADVVVTGIGSNDFAAAFAKDEIWQDDDSLSRDFGTALLSFLRDRVRENPGAVQVLLAFGEYGDRLVRPYRAAEAALRADGVRVVLVTLPKLKRDACFWHPSQEDHRLIADWLATAISSAGT
ncbi:lipase [Paracoccus sp. KR1-242]|uniref:lipase n=1 Tax=Paracoccus sp. KR1-242 TaxID=3410028 RepID=UPI003C00C670